LALVALLDQVQEHLDRKAQALFLTPLLL